MKSQLKSSYYCLKLDQIIHNRRDRMRFFVLFTLNTELNATAIFQSRELNQNLLDCIAPTSDTLTLKFK